MLVLTRKYNQSILIGDNIAVKVVQIDREQVRLAISAPADIKIDREEIRAAKLAQAREAASSVPSVPANHQSPITSPQ